MDKVTNGIREVLPPVPPPMEAEIQPEPTAEEKLAALMQFLGLDGRANGGVFEVVKIAPETGDYTNPIQIPAAGLMVEAGKWYYTTDKDLPHEARRTAFVTPEDFYNPTFFEFID